MNTKAAIVFEMAVLIGGALVIHRQTEKDWWDTIVSMTRVGIGVTIVGAVLLTADDFGAGNVAAAFGGLSVLGYLLGAAGVLGPALQQAEQSAFSSPTASGKAATNVSR